MNEIKQASMYLRVLWLNDNENLRPDDLYVHVEGDIIEETTFTITSTDNNVGNNSPWENVTGWANGITYNYQKEQQEASETNIEEQAEVSNIPYVIPNVVNIPTNYRCNILKNAETEDYAYYTIKMTYVPPKRKKVSRNVIPSLNFNGTQIENVSFNGIQIDKVVFNGVTVFERQQTVQSFKDIILANSTLNEGTPNFSLTATTNEGMFETDDPMYGESAKSQYFRGAVTNNYVKFANFWWRIIRINGDGTVRLIYDETTRALSGVKYSDNSSDFSTSDLKEALENWLTSNIGNNVNITNGHYYNDQSEDAFSRAALAEPTLQFINQNYDYIGKVAIITSDEAMLAGLNLNDYNNSNYLQNQQNTFTMSLYGIYSTNIRMFRIYTTTEGIKLYWYNAKNTFFANPVINLKADVQVTGTGTIDDPYVVVGAE